MSPTAPHNALELMNIAASIARQAGDLVATGRARGTGNVDIKSSPTDIVTQWDQASESLIVGRLGDLRPNDSVLGEEGTQTPGTSGITWLVDPIDGTTNFYTTFLAMPSRSPPPTTLELWLLRSIYPSPANFLSALEAMGRGSVHGN